MARIIPPVGSVFGPRTPAVQHFRPGRAPAKKSKAEEAAEILKLINASIATGQAVYGLGSTIARDFAPTEAEKLAERQEAMIDAGTRSAVAARKTMDQPKVDAALQAREQAMARMQDAREERAGEPSAPIPLHGEAEARFTAPPLAPTTAARTFTFTPRAGGGAWSKQIMEQAAAQGVTVPPEEAMKMQLGTSTMFPGARMTQDSVGKPLKYNAPGAAPAPSPAAAPTPAAPSGAIGQLIDRPLPDKRLVVKFMAAIDSLPANVASIEEKVALKERIKDKYLGTYEAAGGKREEMTPRQLTLLDIISGGRARSILEVQRGVGTPVTRTEFLRQDSAPSVSDLSSSYNALMSQGRESEARELLGMALMAADAAAYIKSPLEPQRLTEYRIRDVIKSGFKGAKAVPGEELSLTEATKVLPPPPRARRRGGKTPPGGKRKPPVPGGTVTVGGVPGFTPDEAKDSMYVIVAIARGHAVARSLKGKETDKGVPKMTAEVDRLQKKGDSLSADTVKALDAANENWRSTTAVKAAEKRARESAAQAKTTESKAVIGVARKAANEAGMSMPRNAAAAAATHKKLNAKIRALRNEDGTLNERVTWPQASRHLTEEQIASATLPHGDPQQQNPLILTVKEGIIKSRRDTLRRLITFSNNLDAAYPQGD